MNPARIAWGVFALTMVLVPTGFVLNTIGGQDTFFIYVVFQLFFAAVQLTTACVGAVVASRLPGNRVGWILLAIGAGLGVRQALGGWGGLGAATAGGLPGDDVAAWMTEWVFILVIAGGVVFLLHLFPNGRFMSRRWRLVGIASGAIVVLVTVASALRPGQLNSVEEFENPLAVTGALATSSLSRSPSRARLRCSRSAAPPRRSSFACAGRPASSASRSSGSSTR